MKELSTQFLFFAFLLCAPFVRGGWSVEPPHIDLGCFPANAPPPARFVIVNHDEAPLQEVRVRTDCGCLLAKTGGTVVPPNGSLEMVIKVAPEGISGTFLHSVFIEAGEEFRRVSVSGESAPLLNLRPSSVMNLGSIPPGAPIHAEFTLSAESRVEFGPAVCAGLEAKTVRLNVNKYLLVLDGRAPDTAGFFRLETEVPVVFPAGWKSLHPTLVGRVSGEMNDKPSCVGIPTEKGATGK